MSTAKGRHEVKQKKHILSLDHEVDFELIGICSHHSDYRLAWGINQTLRLQLGKSDELFAMTNRKGQVISEHSYHFWFDEENNTEYYLIKNKCDGKIMLPEKAQIDYFLFVRDNVLLELEDVVEELKKINSVMAAYVFDPAALPSTEQIVF